jgi:Zn-finger domain-containing protein
MISFILTLVIGGFLLYGAYLIVEDKQAEWELKRRYGKPTRWQIVSLNRRKATIRNKSFRSRFPLTF